MPKLKTNKTVAKRVTVTKRGKLLKRHGGQDHFNSRDPGKITRKKRRDQSMPAAYVKSMKKLMPHA
ncbi:50S ribosomal protein L35 [Candidatus Uhrbacteria bacterium]|nr:50S ribosomal protein L35 [Candidatus Uhrbacteria bacterium]